VPQDKSGLTIKLLVVAVAMFGFGYLLVPIYNVFCEITGLNGKTSGQAIADVVERPDFDRMITIEFVGTVNQNAPWEFEPTVETMRVHPGKLYETRFVARNLSAEPLTAHAVPSVSPGRAAQYFQKTECFCFTEQKFDVAEEKDMPVRFILDPEMPGYIDTVSLSYTFFTKQ
jgi:cytochrome c oxidase assembly protein subunit 11